MALEAISLTEKFKKEKMLYKDFSTKKVQKNRRNVLEIN